MKLNEKKTTSSLSTISARVKVRSMLQIRCLNKTNYMFDTQIVLIFPGKVK